MTDETRVLAARALGNAMSVVHQDCRDMPYDLVDLPDAVIDVLVANGYSIVPTAYATRLRDNMPDTPKRHENDANGNWFTTP